MDKAENNVQEVKENFFQYIWKEWAFILWQCMKLNHGNASEIFQWVYDTMISVYFCYLLKEQDQVVVLSPLKLWNLYVTLWG